MWGHGKKKSDADALLTHSMERSRYTSRFENRARIRSVVDATNLNKIYKQFSMADDSENDQDIV